MKRFDALKVGDKITATYYENIVLRVKEPGEKDVNTTCRSADANRWQEARRHRGPQRTITATITAIDPKIPSITLSGPNNWKYSSRVDDKDALKQVKVGDRLDITWTEAVLLSATRRSRSNRVQRSLERLLIDDSVRLSCLGLVLGAVRVRRRRSPCRCRHRTSRRALPASRST